MSISVLVHKKSVHVDQTSTAAQGKTWRDCQVIIKGEKKDSGGLGVRQELTHSHTHICSGVSLSVPSSSQDIIEILVVIDIWAWLSFPTSFSYVCVC